jgi:GNAT superfamily N-acetyltransferase
VAELPPIFAPVLKLEAVAAGSWYLNVLAVHSEHRGHGVGSLLLSKAFETAASAGASEITLIVEGAITGLSPSIAARDSWNGSGGPISRFRAPPMPETGYYSGGRQLEFRQESSGQGT